MIVAKNQTSNSPKSVVRFFGTRFHHSCGRSSRGLAMDSVAAMNLSSVSFISAVRRARRPCGALISGKGFCSTFGCTTRRRHRSRGCTTIRHVASLRSEFRKRSTSAECVITAREPKGSSEYLRSRSSAGAMLHQSRQFVLINIPHVASSSMGDCLTRSVHLRSERRLIVVEFKRLNTPRLLLGPRADPSNAQ